MNTEVFCRARRVRAEEVPEQFLFDAHAEPPATAARRRWTIG
jgi:hypothetical protein